MREYSVYCLDREGKNVDAQTIMAASDEEAVKQARLLKGLRLCEIWQGHRLIAKITEFDVGFSGYTPPGRNAPASRESAI